ncbi:lysophosphatidic acid receptor 4 [Sphaerodactylus townsendi]|uniref:Lysophosphatidic acid receptor 4 n=1 Tax=Sphaerodactylus townsendi TaxID=933632 RepID=A0ACB8FWG0_9SAUR|nr:lysophosphatidic acid receptor 4 [Sphaerodactylus townsendi]XP_048371058.1 lysophosphatidic acid receptor 4 [Sphaerodactylus townsendi]
MGNHSNNHTCVTDDSFKYNLYGAVYSVVFILGLITNCASLFMFCFRIKMRNETTIFMTNLAFSDLLFVFTLPFKIFYNFNRHWPFGDTLCKISGTAFLTNIYGSMLFLTCISVDRFLAIVYPFRSRTIRTRKNSAIVCAGVWILVLSGGISASLFSTTNTYNTSTTCFEGFSKRIWKTYLSKITIFIEVVGFIIPLMLNLTCASLVLRTLRKPDTLSQIGTNKDKVLRMIVVHVAIFIVCFVPYNSILFLYALVRSQAIANCSLERFARTLYPITLCVATLNCCFDPFIYYFTSESFQKSFYITSDIKSDSLCRTENPLSTHTILPVIREETSVQAIRNGRDRMSESHF